ncbi:hypothetical protein NONO_c17860 [Nocardia nova SH22a]|uniref:Uncharacterized protein n=1 Tax=Nocardia nova SH22a TaxID=1415166 RepID=W5TH65_9NOCA|nr:hypothetical protein [Nocardia nova]AHH16586.1 hypothetical protein NONO_c17860 [Nocardia nova SH22a]
MRLPTEAEILEAARELGHLDEDGKYPQRLRPKLAAALQAQWEEEARDLLAGPAPRPTAEVLADLDRDLLAVGLGSVEIRRSVLAEAAAYLLKTSGMQRIPDQNRR